MRSGKSVVVLAVLGVACLLSLDASAERKKRQRHDDSPPQGTTAEGAAEASTDGSTSSTASSNEDKGARSERDDWTPYALRDDVELNARWWSAERIGSTFALDLRGQGMVTPNVAIAFTFPWTFNVRDAGDPIAALGNPTLDVHYVARAGIVTWHAGGGISAPLASIEDDSGAYRIAALAGGATLAFYDAHLYIPAFLPLRAFGGVEIRPKPFVSIRLGASPMFFVPLEGGGDLEVNLQEYADVIALGDAGFGGGLRLQGVHPLTSGGDLAQISVEPYVAYDDKETFFAKVGLLMALDTPLGFAFDRGKVATLHLGIGGYLDGSGGDSF